MPIGHLPTGPDFNAASAVSDNGVAVGNSDIAGGYVAFRWTQATGIQSIGDLPGGDINTEAIDISADGSVVVGFGLTASGYEAYRWTTGGGFEALGFNGSDTQSFAFGISADGSTVVGRSDGVASAQAVRWTASEGIVPLGILPGGTFSSANAASADGSIIGGASSSTASKASFASAEAVRWDNDVLSSMNFTYTDPFSGNQLVYDASVEAISADGSVMALNTPGDAYRWTADTGFTKIPRVMDGNFSHGMNAIDISGDGQIIVGAANANNLIANRFERASIWTPSTGQLYLQDYLNGLGVTGFSGWTLFQATSVSPNGRYIAGFGLNPSGKVEGYVVDLMVVPEPSALALAGVGALGLLVQRVRRRAFRDDHA